MYIFDILILTSRMMQESAVATLYYFHDPMCSWCWGYRPTWQALKEHLPSSIRVEYMVGGLAPDSQEPMPIAMQEQIQAIWHRIHSQLGTEFNFEFWHRCTPRRSTYPACRAVLAAKEQGKELDMVLAIQQAYYLQACNPSDNSLLIELAGRLNLDEEKFVSDLHSEAIESKLMQQVDLARQWQVPGFPGLILEIENGIYSIPVDYLDYQSTLDQIDSLVAHY